MLTDKKKAFGDVVRETAAKVGRSAPAIVQVLLEQYCPQGLHACEQEGVDGYLRNGLAAAVRTIIKDKGGHGPQADFSEIEETFGRNIVEIVKRLQSDAHFVPSVGEHLPIRELMGDLSLLDEARKFKRQKGIETIEEANRLDQLYEALCV